MRKTYLRCMCVIHSRESVESAAWPAWFHLPGGVAAGWRWCVRSALGRWCSCPWCCPADSSAGASWGWPPRRELPGLWTPTTERAPTPVWCHWTDSGDTAGGNTMLSVWIIFATCSLVILVLWNYFVYLYLSAFLTCGLAFALDTHLHIFYCLWVH